MSNFFKRPLVLKILSLLLAVFIWVYVINIDDPEIDSDVRSIPITINTSDSTPYKNGLAITEGLSQTIDVKIRGRHSAISAYDTSQITATVDINSVTEEGTVSLPVTVYVPGDNVWLVNHTPTKLTYTFSKIATQEVPVLAVIEGEQNGEYIVDTASTNPLTVKVTGPVSEVNYVSYAAAKVDITNVAGDVSLESEIILINKDNMPVRSKNMTCDTSIASVDIKMNKKKTVNLTFDISGDNAVDEFNSLIFEIFPRTVEIAGRPEIVDKISEIKVGTVNAELMSAGEETYLKIPLPEGVTLLSDVESARVTAHTSQKDIKVIENVLVDSSGILDIDLQGHDIQLSSSTINVTVSGTAEELSKIERGNITAIADFSLIRGEAGLYEIPVSVTLDAENGAAVVGTYTISVEVK